jgi:hypothetical protein
MAEFGICIPMGIKSYRLESMKTMTFANPVINLRKLSTDLRIKNQAFDFQVATLLAPRAIISAPRQELLKHHAA